MDDKQDNVIKRLPLACANEESAVLFLEYQRWGDTPACPHCGSVDVYKMKGRDGKRNKRFLWKCNDCTQQYTVRKGTVFEESRIPLRHWCFAFWRACSSKKGVSALEVHRQTGVSHKSALFMLHRIRFAMAEDHAQPEPMKGTVEVDETYVGGKPRNKGSHNIKKRGHGTDKTPVVAIVQRGGNVRARVMPKVNAKNVGSMVRQNVHKDTFIYTDESSIYKHLKDEYMHDSVNHSVKEYVRGEVTTNTVEGFFSILKRGINGIYHSVSKEHLHRYVGEYEYRYNTRKLTDGERVVQVIKASEGKRLFYKQPVRVDN